MMHFRHIWCHLFTFTGADEMAFTDLRARTNAGEEVSFDVFSGKVVLVVNVARL